MPLNIKVKIYHNSYIKNVLKINELVMHRQVDKFKIVNKTTLFKEGPLDARFG